MEKTENLQHIGNPARASGRLEANPEAVREELERILGSRAFRGIESHKNFLRYAVEQMIQGRGDLIKEYSVGIEVFGRGGSFDPRVDPIVRIQAGRLRSRLAKYYSTEGEQDPLRIEFPKGSYAPVIRPHPSPETSLAQNGKTPHVVHTALTSPSRARFALNKVVAGGLLAAALLLAGSIGFWLRLSRAKSPSVDAPSIAVLPFLNRSDDKEGEVFSDGLTDELINSLGRIPGLHVVARTSSFQYKGKVQDIRKIGQELNVRTVFEGSVRKYGNRLRITAQLDDATNGYRVWSESYDRELKDTLAIQAEISQAITKALGVKLGGPGTSAGLDTLSGKAASVPPDAYNAYLKGLFFFNKNTAENVNMAIGFFQEAIAKYPDYALAYVGLAHCYAQMPVFSETPSMQIVPKIRAAASKALELDNTLGGAHLDLARAFETEFRWPEAESEFRTASELSPGDAVGSQWYGVHLWRMGRMEEALAQNKTAMDLDPISPGASHAVGRGLYFLGRNDDAIDQYKKALVLESDSGIAHGGLGLAYLAKGIYPRAVSEMELSYRLMGQDAWHAGQLGYIYGMTGNTAGANKILTEFLNHARPARALAIATIYIGLRDKDRAFEWLRKAIDEHDVFLLLKADPQYSSLRSDPRFAELLRRMKLN